MARPPRWLARLRDLSTRAAARRTVGWSLGFSVTFLSAALIWSRLPTARPGARQIWTALLLALAIHDFATAVRKLSRARDLPAWTWIVAATVYGVLGAAAVIALARLRRG
jgi:hypothetical protein